MSFPEALSAPLAAALQKKGYGTLTSIQQRVLDPEAQGRDLRISSQTGSGKTVAIGLVLAPSVEAARAAGPRSGPAALVIAPTRELARQVEEELGWLYAETGARVVSVTGGASVRDELRALATKPSVVVGTPGRVLDHVNRGSLDCSELAAVVLDEADRMLDMGFREELEAILAALPAEKRAHLVSATFPREVARLAARLQKDWLQVEGTKLGEANADIEHLAHLVEPSQTLDALVNVLLAHPKGARALVFTQTRAEVGDLAAALAEAGLGVASISGDLEQRERTRALAAFKSGRAPVLVATDVAARGIDVQDIALVVHIDTPNDADTYTHRSGRTGRAGRRGVSVVIVPPRRLFALRRVLAGAKVELRLAPVPSAAELAVGMDQRLVDELAAAGENDAPSPRASALAERLLASESPALTVARLLDASGLLGGPSPREIKAVAPPAPRSRPGAAAPRARGREAFGGEADARGPYERGPSRTAPRTIPPSAMSFTPFRVTWGGLHGADARRLLAMVCRRGGISSADVGMIDVKRTHSVIEIADGVAEAFCEAVSKPDPRDARVSIWREGAEPEGASAAPARAPRAPRPFAPPPGDDARPAHEDRPAREDRPRAPRAAAYEDRPAREDRPRAPRAAAYEDRPRAPRAAAHTEAVPPKPRRSAPGSAGPSVHEGRAPRKPEASAPTRGARPTWNDRPPPRAERAERTERPARDERPATRERPARDARPARDERPARPGAKPPKRTPTLGDVGRGRRPR